MVWRTDGSRMRCRRCGVGAVRVGVGGMGSAVRRSDLKAWVGVDGVSGVGSCGETGVGVTATVGAGGFGMWREGLGGRRRQGLWRSRLAGLSSPVRRERTGVGVARGMRLSGAPGRDSGQGVDAVAVRCYRSSGSELRGPTRSWSGRRWENIPASEQSITASAGYRSSGSCGQGRRDGDVTKVGAYREGTGRRGEGVRRRQTV